MKRLIIICIMLLVGCEKSAEIDLKLPNRSFENRAGTVFTPLPFDLFKAPSVQEISLPTKDSIDAIWGATGRDDNGYIYVGTSSHGGDQGTAFLYQYNHLSGEMISQSDVVSQLKNNNVYREGMRQNKLHSKVYQADDGYLYFSSFDEGGESIGINPTWGGNLWRKLPHDRNWQHILATEEALVAVNTNGYYVYTLGYWNHVLYQYNTQSGEVSRVVVGSVGEHMSRNFIVDELGHAYVPRLTENDFNEIQVSLVEYDTKLNEVATYPMPSYKSNRFKSHHGIVGYTSMKNGDIFFTTAEGSLFQIKPYTHGIDKLDYKGSMHPDGEAYIASLFTYAGDSYIAGVGRKPGTDKYEWIIYEVDSGLSANYLLDTDNYNGLLLYGSLTKNNTGDFFVAGWNKKPNIKGYQPIFLKLTL